MRGSGYVYVHLDEKWFVSLEKKQVLFDTQLTYDNFHRFIAKLTQKRPLLIATGAVDIPLISELKQRLFFCKLSANLFSSDSFDHAAHLVSGTSFTDCVDLLRNASIVITCHGGIVHLASACGVPIIDVVDKEYRHNKQKWVDHMSDHTMMTRTSFDDLAQSLLTELEAM